MIYAPEHSCLYFWEGVEIRRLCQKLCQKMSWSTDKLYREAAGQPCFLQRLHREEGKEFGLHKHREPEAWEG